jgi:hypothetical protein
MFEYSDYLRDQAIKYRELAERDKDLFAIKEFLELADICEEVANDMDDRRVSGWWPLSLWGGISIMDRLTVWEKVFAEFDGRPISGSFAVEQGMVKVTTLKGQRATQVGVFNTTWQARYLLRELAAEGKA